MRPWTMAELVAKAKELNVSMLSLMRRIAAGEVIPR